MSVPDLDVVVVGAGAAGLAALSELDRAGLNVLCLEARNRIGGRIHTIHDPLSPLPIELGAEFIHGRPPETWSIIQAAQLTAYDSGDTAVRISNGKVRDHNAWDAVGRVMAEMQEAAAHGPDRSFAEFLETSSEPQEAKLWAAGYVEGFNAARQERVSIASLAEDAQAADQIDGDSAFRLMNGYDAIPLHLFRGVSAAISKLRLNSIVESIGWHRGSVSIHFRNALTGHLKVLHARRVIVAVPLGVLQVNDIQFQPEPTAALNAARALEFGQVMRVVLRFREAFWEGNADTSFAGFLLSDQRLFPTWWTPLAAHAPIITGWSAGPHADDLLGQPASAILNRAIDSLADVLSTTSSRINNLLEAFYFHDWHADPFARGAYSYVRAGALEARKTLAEPIEDTLYFAGEATETNGHSATVHGALATGFRAARQILNLR